MLRIRLCTVGAVALVAVSCQDHGPPTAVSPPLSAEFLDAMHGGGNPHFYLLPPLISTPDLTKETFESGLQPSVRVTELPGAPGTAFAGCSDKQITYLPTIEFTRLKSYAAFWRPANFPNVKPPCIYRLQVEVFGTAAANSGTVLGFADVQVLSRTTVKYLKTGEYIPLPKDLTLPFWLFIGQGAVFYAQTGGTDACRPGRDCAEAVVSPTKTTTVITKNQGAGILIPAGSFTKQITLTIEEQTERPCIDPGKLGLPEFNANRTGCYRYRRFPADVPVSQTEGAFLTVAMCVDIGGLTHAQADLLQIFRFDAEAEESEAQVLANASAAFLPCEATRFLGLSPRGVPALLAELRALFAPQPLHAATTAALIHTGVGGVCALRKCLSAPVFTWGTPGSATRHSADPQTAPAGTVVAAPPSVLVMDLGNPTLEISPQPIANTTVIFEVTAGGGSIATLANGTGVVTDTLITDANGVATLGRWTLGATPGTNTVQAFVAGAVGSTVTFTASSVVPATLIDCQASVSADLISRGFYVGSFPGTSLRQVTLYLSARTSGAYTFALTSRGGSYDGTFLGTATANVTLTAGDPSVATIFTFSSPAISQGSTATFAISQVSGPTGAEVFYDVPAFEGSTCPVIETEGTTPPLDTFRRQGIRVKIEGDTPVIP